MKIRMLKTAAGPAGVMSAGSEHDVELEFGQALVMADAAEWLETPPKAAPVVEQAAAKPAAEKAQRKPTRRRKAAK